MDEEIKPRAPHVDKQPVVVFGQAQRAELLNLYAGFAMQSTLQSADLTKGSADYCVETAETLICALERYHTAKLAAMGVGDPEAAGAQSVQQH